MLKNACLCLFLLKLKAAADSSVFFFQFFIFCLFCLVSERISLFHDRHLNSMTFQA